MEKHSRPLIEPVSDEQLKKQESISKEIQEAECVAIIRILNNEEHLYDFDKAIENANSFAENITVKFRDPESPKTACKAGCSWCCFQNVHITALEAFRIAAHLQHNFDNSTGTTLIKNLRSLDRRTRGLSPMNRSKLHLPCAFLQNDICSIYSIRPLSCVEFTSYNISDCKRGYQIGYKSDGIIHEKARLIVFNAVQKGIKEGIEKVYPESDNQPLELTAAVLDALDSNIDISGWSNGKDTFNKSHLIFDYDE